MYTHTIHHRTFFDTTHEAFPSLYRCQLPQWTCLNVLGDGAALFLQGQLTCDIQTIPPSQLQQAALCDLKGRIIALVYVCFWDHWRLLCQKDLLPLVHKHLRLPAQLSKVELIEEQSLTYEGIYHSATHPTLNSNDNMQCYTLSDSLTLILHRVNTNAHPTSVDSALPLRGDLAWHYQCLAQGFMTIYPETSGMFLPQRLDLDKTTCVSFQKGCYKGQEIIARMHYRGINKYALQTHVQETPPFPLPGTPIHREETPEVIGEIIDIAPFGEGQCLILASCLKTVVL